MLLWLLISTALAADKLFYSSVVDFLSILCPSRPFPALLLSKLTNQPTTPRKTFNRYSIQQIRFWQTNINCPDNNIFYRSKVHEMNLKNNCHPHFYSSPGKGFAWVLYYIYWIHPTQPHYILQKWRWQLRYEGEGGKTREVETCLGCLWHHRLWRKTLSLTNFSCLFFTIFSDIGKYRKGNLYPQLLDPDRTTERPKDCQAIGKLLS